MKQIRNMVFACLNQSTLNKRVSKNESRHKSVYETCVKLDETDKQMEEETKSAQKSIQNRITKFKEEFAKTQKQNERRMHDHDTKLQH